ncbi:sulfate/molybdate ABC transporter ATP-binding protein [Adlercreutzia sp. ZJ154]|uniref:sulfate/molybdate ABC transporter ATP-binding protein n=1 Tax=Adlercreutzia sp. ZJ154 TaxID=2709790 RepID=UPI0013EABFC9|nr:ATP-binding cassette domain-containing protein [Adlercreutzia sp. ZJ154]
MSLEVRIKKQFRDFTLDVDFQAGNETLGFLGASGCGKSLTMRCIAGIESPDEGRIVVNDKVFFDSQHHINLKPQERKTALLFQNYMLFPNLTVEQNVAAGIGKETPKDESARIVARELSRFGLSGFEKRYPAQLSGGQQQRVALARMLAAKPGILMLDEPFSALDAHLKGVLEQNLVDLFNAYEGTILYVSHDIDEAIRFCDRIAVVEAGRIQELDTPDDLVNNPKSEAALKLSGCKNAPRAEYCSDYSVWVPKWGITVETQRIVPRDVKYIGIRAFYVESADGPGENNYRVRVDRISDSRFDRSVLLGFIDRDERAQQVVMRQDDEMRYLHQHLFWRVNKLALDGGNLPEIGDELWIHLPKDKIYLVAR